MGVQRGYHSPFDLRPPGDWVDLAACEGEDQQLFFPNAKGTGRGADYSAGKMVCRRCPVVSECLEYALDSIDTPAGAGPGLWGGQSPEERDWTLRLRRQR